ncbi:penicillin acylase family protein [Belliella sp. R4-6]|uniref:Penicillin acylase family protein n=1 Tax=Belliella alkalica TaxID=1730871 RepID=A0ABS9V6Z9_9BACT|nr:penicillin acylase family protein [Belliella alkalica]MCH7412196.1 penicillin acylase family protein [Belliella alkalica]
MKKLLILLTFLFLASLIGFQITKKIFAPEYDGNKELLGLNTNAEVYFDDFGIPHIYAENEIDAYLTLGYIHAQDRLFQMEMMRRVGSGTLAELLGEDLVDVDKFFRTLGIPKHAEWSTEEWNQEHNSSSKSATEAYIKGVNQFIENGKLPLEYTLLGEKPRPFTINDVHSIVGYMSFTFAMAMKTDPLVTKISRQLGPQYLDVLSVHTLPEHHVIPNNYPNRNPKTNDINFDKTLISLLDKLPVPLLEGSNSWVIGPTKTASGEVLFLNDTHIGFAQPSVWYEAHIEYPDFSFYGNHLAGVPFGLVGHTREHSIGLTMFENDDQDFFEEKLNPQNSNQVLYKDSFKDLKIRNEKILIKDKEAIDFEIKESIHGPIMNDVIPEIGRLTDNPVASWWVYIQEPTKALEAIYKMNHAKSIQEVEEAVRLIHAPGLNVMYGDKAGNIAWWAAAKLPIRPEQVNSKLFLDGTTDLDEPTGWMPFEENPMSVNPPSGFVASANNQPDTLSNGTFFPGYYYPGDRWNRIAKTVSSRNDWTQENIKSLQLETVNETHPKIAKSMIEAINESAFGDFEKVKQALVNWDGNHDFESISPTVYYKWLYHTLHGMMADELGEADFENFLKTFLYIRSVQNLVQTENSPWWDNTSTEKIEQKKEIILNALEKTLTELESQFGKNISNWQWKNAVKLEHPHPLGAKKPLDRIFNVKASSVPANEESINKLAFDLNGDGVYYVKSGPAMRIIIDFANVEASESVLPTGQSGNVFSPHYSDQAELFATGQYRPQLMNESQIKNSPSGILRFSPKRK